MLISHLRKAGEWTMDKGTRIRYPIAFRRHPRSPLRFLGAALFRSGLAMCVLALWLAQRRLARFEREAYMLGHWRADMVITWIMLESTMRLSWLIRGASGLVGRMDSRLRRLTIKLGEASSRLTARYCKHLERTWPRRRDRLERRTARREGR